MPVNPFALLSTGDSDDEGGDSPAPVKAAPKAAPAKSKSSKGPRKPAAPEKKASVHGTDQEYHAESRGGRGGKGGRGSKAGRGRGGRGDNRTNDRQSRGKDTKTVAKSGHGTGNWGGAKDDINAAASGAADAKAESKAADGEAVEEAEEVEEVQVSADDFFAAEATKKSKFAVKARKVTDADTGDFKVGGAVREKVEEKEINYGGKAAKQKKKSKRSGRKAEQILVDLKFNNESSQMEAKPGEPGYGAGDGGKGGKGGKGKGGKGGKGKGGGRGGGKGKGKGGRGGAGGRGRGGGGGGGGRGGGRGGFNAISEDAFPSL